MRWQLVMIGITVLAGARPLPAAEPPTLLGVQRIVAEQPEAREERSWKFIVLHHSAAENGSVETIDTAHRQRLDANGVPWRGIGYHFVIGNGHGMDDGEIRSTFRWREQCEGAHAGVTQFNQHGIGICLIGNFEERNPTPAQLMSLMRLVQVLRQEYGIEDTAILAHRDIKPTACPGGQFPLARIRTNTGPILKASAVRD
ncbi:MAG: N-acetylmuramoyl-L-alanine amidase [Planctomycetaceae bacterium]